MGKPIVVYAEDVKGVRVTTTSVLRSEGYDVHAHENGKLALEDVKTLKAEGQDVVILTDNEMPEMTGVELLKALKDANIRVPAIMMTGDSNIQTKLADAGVTGHLDKLMEKPLDIAKLRVAMNEVYTPNGQRGLPRSALDYVHKPMNGAREI